MIRIVFMMVCMGLLSGCITSGETRAPVEDRTGGDTNYGNTIIENPESDSAETAPYVAPPAPKPLAPPAETSKPATNNAAVGSLVSIADTKIKQGDYSAASAALERALRHDANNAKLWHRLAEVRLRQSEFAQAESLALKSNALADGDKALMSSNWTLISKSRRLRGDGEGADEAEVRAYQLTR